VAVRQLATANRKAACKVAADMGVRNGASPGLEYGVHSTPQLPDGIINIGHPLQAAKVAEHFKFWD
jgi:hypothetical protein